MLLINKVCNHVSMSDQEGLGGNALAAASVGNRGSKPVISGGRKI